MNVYFSVVWDPSLKNLAAVSFYLFLDEALLESFLNDKILGCSVVFFFFCFVQFNAFGI